jgi:6-phosphogluconolactonase (cycloisomerase 2 family)
MVAILALVAVAFLVACSTKYKSTSNGLVVVPTQGTLVMQTFSLDLSNGHVSQINNADGPPTPGIPGAVILDPSGTFAYVIVQPTSTAPGGVVSYKVGSDGKLAAGVVGPTLQSETPTVNAPCLTANTVTVPVSVLPTHVVPGSLAIDSAGKYLFVADVSTSGQTNPYQCNGSTVTATVTVPGAISVYSVSNGALTEVAGSPFVLPDEPSGNGTAPGSAGSAAALAVTPTVFPVRYAACSGNTPPTTENLYVADSVNDVLLNYSVASSGALTLVPASASVSASGVVTGGTPSGVAVDACGQFVYVANAASNSVSAFTICSAVSQNCLQADYSLQAVSSSPYPTADTPGPIAVDPFAKYVYVVDTGASQLSGFRISPANGSLTAIPNTPVATNSGANSIAVRADGNWIFVGNFNTANISQYAITPATGQLTPQPPFATLNYPSGVAVK